MLFATYFIFESILLRYSWSLHLDFKSLKPITSLKVLLFTKTCFMSVNKLKPFYSTIRKCVQLPNGFLFVTKSKLFHILRVVSDGPLDCRVDWRLNYIHWFKSNNSNFVRHCAKNPMVRSITLNINNKKHLI